MDNIDFVSPPTKSTRETTLKRLLQDISTVNSTSTERHLKLIKLDGTCVSFNMFVPKSFPEQLIGVPGNCVGDMKIVTEVEWKEGVNDLTHGIVDEDGGQRIVDHIRSLLPPHMPMSFTLFKCEIPLLITPALIVLLVQEDNHPTHGVH